MPASASSNSPVTLINIFTVAPADQPRLLALLRENTETVIRGLKGWIATSIVAGSDGTRVAIYSQWETSADIAAMRADPRMQAYLPQIKALAAFDSVVGDVALAHRR
jgi:quinol monooxygenase YgiN